MTEDVDNVFEGTISMTIFRGAFIEYRVILGRDIEFIVFKPHVDSSAPLLTPGSSVKIGWNRDSGIILVE